MQPHYPELFKDVKAIFISREGVNEDTYGKDEGPDWMWEVTSAGYHGRYSIPKNSDNTMEFNAGILFKQEFRKQAEMRELDWEHWETIRLTDDY